MKEELVILDKMAELLATPEKWCKGMLQDERGARCLAGALHALCREIDVFFVVREKLTELCGFPKYTLFNDAVETEHKDILNLIARARKELE